VIFLARKHKLATGVATTYIVFLKSKKNKLRENLCLRAFVVSLTQDATTQQTP
jgi:hypothetical protein